MRAFVLTVSGRVQGVGFRACVKRIADSLAITGEVLNLADGRVRIVAVAEEMILEKFISMLYGCPRAIVRDVRGETVESDPYSDFQVRRGLF
ncbi:MAG TPA: acylphosphatase [Methanoregulaceae archaeon]|nr:acylphosphatase [Methanoregulaceae archaeon]HQJ88608.1 acylphosphatase [Methanoregulaceae archaeon]